MQIYAGSAGVKGLQIDRCFIHVYVLAVSSLFTRNAFCNGYATQKRNFANYAPIDFHLPQVSILPLKLNFSRPQIHPTTPYSKNPTVNAFIQSHVSPFSIFTRYAEAVATLNSIQWIFRDSCSCSKVLVALHNCGLSMARRGTIDCMPNI